PTLLRAPAGRLTVHTRRTGHLSGAFTLEPLPRRVRPGRRYRRNHGLKTGTPMLETVITRERDLGTPARDSDTLVTLDIDGIFVTVPEGTSVMRAAAEAGVDIPKLCAS